MTRLVRSAFGAAAALGLWFEGPATALSAQQPAGPSESQLVARVAAEPGKPGSHLDLALFYYRARRPANTEQAVTAAIERLKADRTAQVAALAAAPAPALPRVGIDVPEPGMTKEARATYPAGALKAGVLGCVIIDAVIDKEGRVKNAKVIRSVPKLDKAALDAVRQWRFVPTVTNGRVVDIAAMLTVNFRFRPDFAEDLACAGFYWAHDQFEVAERALVRALATLRQERVWPALLNGKAVPFKVIIQLEFLLH